MVEKIMAAIILATAVTVSVLLTRFFEHRKQKQIYRDIEMVLASFVDSEQGERTLNDMIRTQDITVDDSDWSRILRQLIQLKNALDTLRESNIAEKEETRAMVTDIAHQLKTPVSVMDMCLALLEDEQLSQNERLEFQQRFRNAMTELETLMDSLIQISRMETGLITLQMKAIPIADTIRNAVSFMISRADEKQIAIELEDMDDSASQILPHDPKWLGEALINILDNAIKYSPPDSRIIIRTIHRNAFLRIEIEDEGIGIPVEERNKVLSRFYRGKNALVAASSGSGVGLYLVNKIVRLHGGMVHIHSGSGNNTEYPGTNMVLQIPDK